MLTHRNPVLRRVVTGGVNRLKTLAHLAGELAAAYAGYRVALYFSPNADIRGGFLLLSPLFAILAVVLLGPWDFFARNRQGQVPAPSDLQQRVDRISEKVGSPPIEALVDESKVRSGSVMWFLDEKLCFRLSEWMELPTTEQDFKLASEIVGHLLDAHARERRWLVDVVNYGTFVVGSIIACLNLWSILAVQVGAAVPFVWWLRWYLTRRTLATDERAVRATADLEGAIAYIRNRPSDGFISTERRIANLRTVFASSL